MTLYLDTSALLRRYVRTAGSILVEETMAADGEWCTSALTRTELLLALSACSVTSHQRERLWDRARLDWESFWVVPTDGRCLAEAADTGSRYGLRTVDAIHLASASRLPSPKYVTFDRRQIPGASALGFEVVSPA